MKCIEVTVRPLDSASANPESFARLKRKPARSQRVPFLTPSDATFRQLHAIAASMGISLEKLYRLKDLHDWMEQEEPAAVLTDSTFDDGDWRDVLDYCRQHAASPPVIVTTRTDSASLWAEVAESGAADLLAQPFYASEARRCLKSVTEVQLADEVPEPTI